MRVDPVSQLLGLGRLGVGEATGAEHGDKQLDAPQLPVRRSTRLGRLPEKSMNVFLAGAVHLPHRRPQPSRRLPVDLEELGAAVAARMNLGVLLQRSCRVTPSRLSSRWMYAQSGRTRSCAGAARRNNRASSAARPARPAAASPTLAAQSAADTARPYPRRSRRLGLSRGGTTPARV